VALTHEAQAVLVECAATRHDWIGNAGRPNRTTTSSAYRRTADFRVSTTDPDATPMPGGDGGTHLGYQDHYLEPVSKFSRLSLNPGERAEASPSSSPTLKAAPRSGSGTRRPCTSPWTATSLCSARTGEHGIRMRSGSPRHCRSWCSCRCCSRHPRRTCRPRSVRRSATRRS
jgi:hypothetical protein